MEKAKNEPHDPNAAVQAVGAAAMANKPKPQPVATTAPPKDTVRQALQASMDRRW